MLKDFKNSTTEDLKSILSKKCYEIEQRAFDKISNLENR